MGPGLSTLGRGLDGADEPLSEPGRLDGVRGRGKHGEFGRAEPSKDVGHTAGGLQHLHALHDRGRRRFARGYARLEVDGEHDAR